MGGGTKQPAQGAYFAYTSADGLRHLVRVNTDGTAPVPRAKYSACVRVETGDQTSDTWLVITQQVPMMVPEPDDPLSRLGDSYWMASLRRLAMDQAMNWLDRASPPNENTVIDASWLGTLARFAFRRCDFQKRTERDDLVCGCSVRNPATTLYICELCDVPDPWERCRYLCNVRTVSLEGSGGVLKQQLSTASCQIGSVPASGGGPGEGCRYGPSTPICFAPRDIRAVSSGMGPRKAASAVGVLSSLNVEWKRRHGYQLFAPVSFDPLATLGDSCANGAEYHRGVLALAELIQQLDEPRLRDRLDEKTSEGIQQGQTLTVLAAVLRRLGYPRADAAIGSLRSVYALRNLPPTHPPQFKAAQAAADAARGPGYSGYVARDDWPGLWAATLRAFADGIELILRDVEADAETA